MKAAFINETGPTDKIIYGELPVPQPTGTQVRVKVGAVSVNPIDTYIRAGMIAMALPKPFIIGCDVAGMVEAVGPDVKTLKVGDRVWGTNQGLLGRQGTFAEQIVVEEQWLYPIPSGVKDECAAAVALVGITAHLGLFRDAKLQTGETIFVRGGTGGVGSMVVQMAKAAGARVITTAGSEDKVKLAKELGADHVIAYRTQKLDEELKKLAPSGVNVWWETLREPDFDLAVSTLTARGRMILMAGREARPPFPVGPFYVKGCSLFGFAMFNATPAEQQHCSVDINRWLLEGKLRSRIDRVLPLSQAAEAHRLQEESTLQKSGALGGKIVLKP
ncbi:MAG TPA: NADPH:quinone reductase [Verrucomicrobiae bacterium]